MLMANKYENYYNAEKKELNLSHSNMRCLDSATIQAYGSCCEYLDLSHNRLSTLEWLLKFPRLKCLILDENRLRESHFEKLKEPLPNLQILMLNKNELSDLKTTVGILRRHFPNIMYLSLHGNPICPDNLYLQPFSEFVPYEYNYYRLILTKALPNLKFLDHFSLDNLKVLPNDGDISRHSSNFQTNLHDHQAKQQLQHNPHSHHHHQQQQQQQHQLEHRCQSKDLWSKLKSFLSTNKTSNSKSFSLTTRTTANDRTTTLVGPSTSTTSSTAPSYKGLQSEELENYQLTQN